MLCSLETVVEYTTNNRNDLYAHESAENIKISWSISYPHSLFLWGRLNINVYKIERRSYGFLGECHKAGYPTPEACDWDSGNKIPAAKLSSLSCSLETLEARHENAILRLQYSPFLVMRDMCNLNSVV
jgi:hypothetical protein